MFSLASYKTSKDFLGLHQTHLPRSNGFDSQWDPTWRWKTGLLSSDFRNTFADLSVFATCGSLQLNCGSFHERYSTHWPVLLQLNQKPFPRSSKLSSFCELHMNPSNFSSNILKWLIQWGQWVSIMGALEVPRMSRHECGYSPVRKMCFPKTGRFGLAKHLRSPAQVDPSQNIFAIPSRQTNYKNWAGLMDLSGSG